MRYISTNKVRTMNAIWLAAGLQMALLAATGSAADPPAGTNVTAKTYAKADLPKDGKIVLSASERDVQYFFATAWQKVAWAAEGKIGGQEIVAEQRRLFRSTNGGATWMALCDDLNFVEVFVHPDTHVVYGIIAELNALIDNKEGILVRRHLVWRIVMSDDGRNWKDITGGEWRHSRFSGLGRDSDHPGRIELDVNGTNLSPHINRARLRSIDDEYTRWEAEAINLFFE